LFDKTGGLNTLKMDQDIVETDQLIKELDQKYWREIQPDDLA